MTHRIRRIAIETLVAALVTSLPVVASAQDDTDLFTTAVPPNVMLLVDNSGSMNSIVWHPAFDPTVTPAGCAFWDNDSDYFLDQADGDSPSGSWDSRFGPGTYTRCGNTRTIFVDPAVQTGGGDNDTRWSGRYLNWYFSDAADAHATAITTETDTYSACVQNEYGLTTFSSYRRARVTAARDVLREVICNSNQAGAVRFGLAQFRLPGGSGDPNGGFVRVPINDYDVAPYSLNGSTRTHGQHLDLAIEALRGQTWTPLGESLFQIYTYFMSRDASDRPVGADGTTVFPRYSYRTTTSGNYGPPVSNSSQLLADPVQFSCQKNFVIVITDGEPTKDTFYTGANTGDGTNVGFSSFSQLIGNYDPDAETEVGGAACAGGSLCALYLDDIAKFMHERDFRPDLSDVPNAQTLDIYTVGFSTTPEANDLLSRTATAGNGLFFSSNNAEELATALVSSVTDIIQKSQSFTAATVPATRTADGGNIYTSLFVPSDDPYWMGQLKLFQITSDGDILDANDNCALLNPLPVGECKSGQISPSAVPFWDAADEIPSPPSRVLVTSLPGVGKVDFDTSLAASALGDPNDTSDDLSAAAIPLYAGSGATDAEDLADDIIENVRGCTMGTGGATCVPRPFVLGDIFHSNPLVVGRPRSFINETSYRAFQTDFADRDNVIYAGSNGGFVHGFHAGDWQPLATPPAYDRGTGTELFGFMPWPVRQNAKQLPIDSGARDTYGVDGSPVAADVWIHSTATQTAKAADGSEWRTVLAGGLRQGGRSYYALDITDPDAAGFPGYLWEFPAEDASASERAFLGETWGKPILTKVKVEIGGIAYERWVAIVSGGYDRRSDPNDALNYDVNATAGRALYILDLKTGQVLGEKKFDPSATDGRQKMLYAMAGTPSVFDADQDGFADVIYMGDLGGNVWKWVLKYDPLASTPNFLVDPINSTGSVLQPDTKFRKFFEAKATPASTLGVTVGSTTYYKSIFFPPSGTIVKNRFWLAFGTGERADLSRTHDTSTTAENNSFYSVKDEDVFDRRLTLIPTLTEQDLQNSTLDATCPNLASVSGFFFRVEDDEKFVTDTAIFSFWVIASTFVPSGSADPCNSGGQARLYIFKVHCGQGFFFNNATTPSSGAGGPGGSGGLSDPSLPDFGDPASRYIELGAGMPTDPRVTTSPDGPRVLVTRQDGQISNVEGPEGDGGSPGQLYWREMTGEFTP